MLLGILVLLETRHNMKRMHGLRHAGEMRFCKGYAHVLVHWVKDTSAVGSDLLWVANTALLNHCRGCQTNMSSGWEYREWYIGLPPRTEAQDTASLCKKHPQTTHTFHPLTLTFCLMRILFTLFVVCMRMYVLYLLESSSYGTMAWRERCGGRAMTMRARHKIWWEWWRTRCVR